MVCLENEVLYGIQFDVSDAAMDKNFLLPIGKAHIQRVGKHCTVTAYSRGVHTAMAAADMLAAEVYSTSIGTVCVCECACVTEV